MAIYLSPAAIAALKACTVQGAHKALRAGHYGPPIRHKRRVYVALAGVEKRLGRLTTTQIAAVVADKLRRQLIIDTSMETP
jgi:hypothetical protein